MKPIIAFGLIMQYYKFINAIFFFERLHKNFIKRRKKYKTSTGRKTKANMVQKGLDQNNKAAKELRQTRTENQQSEIPLVPTLKYKIPLKPNC